MSQESSKLENRITALETKIAFQDQTIEDLNAVITELRHHVDRLTEKFRQLADQATGTFVSKDSDNLPPHY